MTLRSTHFFWNLLPVYDGNRHCEHPDREPLHFGHPKSKPIVVSLAVALHLVTLLTGTFVILATGSFVCSFGVAFVFAFTLPRP